MGRTQPGITIDEELWSKAKETYGARNCSDRIEELIAEDLDKDISRTFEEYDVLDQANLTPSQEDLAAELLKRNNFPYQKGQIGNIAREEGIYQRSNFVKKAVRKLCKNQKAPFTTKSGRIIQDTLECECGANIMPKALQKTDSKCPKCKRDIRLDGLNV